MFPADDSPFAGFVQVPQLITEGYPIHYPRFTIIKPLFIHCQAYVHIVQDFSYKPGHSSRLHSGEAQGWGAPVGPENRGVQEDSWFSQAKRVYHLQMVI